MRGRRRGVMAGMGVQLMAVVASVGSQDNPHCQLFPEIFQQDGRDGEPAVLQDTRWSMADA